MSFPISISNNSILSNSYVLIANTVNSVSSTGGSLVVNGGLGVSKSVVLGTSSIMTIQNTITSTSSSTGALIVSGGLGIQGPINTAVQNYYILTSGTIQTVSDSTITELTTYFNGGTVFGSGSIITNSSAGRLQVSQPGLYLYGSNIAWNFNGTGNRQLWIGVNGSNTSNRRSFSLINPVALDLTAHDVSAPLVLSANDYVSSFVFQTSGGNLNLISSVGVNTYLVKLV